VTTTAPPSAATASPGQPAEPEQSIPRTHTRPRRGPSTRAGLRLGATAVAGLIVALGLAATLDAADRGGALQNAATRAEPLAVAAEDIYRDLSDADATAAAVFLSGAQADSSGPRQYDNDVRQIAAALAAVSADAATSPQLRAAVARITTDLPVYTNLVGTAQADSRQNLPVGAAYLREASGLMRADLLPAAQQVLNAETDRLSTDGATASSGSEVELALAALAVVALVVLQLFLARRTNRLANLGLAAATLLVLAVALWSGVSSGATADASDTASAHRHAADALATTDLDVLRAHGDELLSLAARGEDVGSYANDFKATAKRLTAELKSDQGFGIGGAQAAFNTWLTDDKTLVDQETAPQRNNAANIAALAEVTESDVPGSGQDFTSVDRAVHGAVHTQEQAYLASINAGRADVAGLAAGCAILAAAALAAAGYGVNQRLREYR
jgi:hypothetical protein